MSLHAEDYTLGPDSQPHDGVPKGTVTKFILAPGKDYPGTPHNCAVYVPAQYDAEQANSIHDFSRRQPGARATACACQWSWTT